MKKNHLFTRSITILFMLFVVGCTIYVKPNVEHKGNIHTDPITDLAAAVGKEKITLNWKNPVNVDLAKVVITSEPAVTIAEVTDGATSKEITGLTNGTKYTFTVKTVDKTGNESLPVTKEVPLYMLTETPVMLTDYISPYNPPVDGDAKPTGADGKWQYVEFGDYPQSRVEKLPDGTVESDTVNMGGLHYICGSDGHYYIKVKAAPFTSDYSPEPFYFDDGTEVVKDNYYYFKVEPVKWRVLDNNYKDVSDKPITGKLLFAEKTLCAQKYHESSNNYSTSLLRNFLMNDFKNQLFTTAAQEKINEITVDNSLSSTKGRGDESSGNPTVCDNTKDKIFVLSADEATRAAYGFDESGKGSSVRTRKTTEYARATGSNVSYVSTLPDLDNNGWVWLRSPDSDEGYSRCIENAGKVVSNHYSHTDESVVPAIIIEGK